MRKVEEMSERELLMELVEEKRNRDKLQILGFAIMAALVLIIIVALFIYVPKIINVINEFNKISGQISELSESIKKIPTDFNIDTDKFSDLMEQLQGIFKMFGLAN